MDTVTIEQTAADRPPAGTPCVVCIANGHHCQADQYAAGDGDAAICNACLNGHDCQVVAMRRKRDFTFEPEVDSGPVAPARSVPVPQAVIVDAPAPIQLSAPRRDTPDMRPRFEAIAGRLLKLDPGESVAFAIPVEMKAKEFERQLIEFLGEYPDTATIKWIHHPDETGQRLVMATMANVKKRVARTPVPAAKPAPPITPPSPPIQIRDRETVAEGMLRSNYSVQVVQQRTGLARDAVLEIEQRLGLTKTAPEKAVQPVEMPPTPPEISAPVAPVASKPSPSKAPDLTEDMRKAIVAGSPETPAAEFAKRFGVSLSAVYLVRKNAGINGWSSKGRPVKPAERDRAVELLQAGASIRQTVAQTGLTRNTVKDVRQSIGMTDEKPDLGEHPVREKPELAVATPVTIVTVPAEPGITLSRAFELVIAEIESSVDNMRDSRDDSDEWKACVKTQEMLAGELRAWHPAVMGMSATGSAPSIYERAMERAEAELGVINLEIQRLEMRRKALEPILQALKTSIHWERESR